MVMRMFVFLNKIQFIFDALLSQISENLCHYGTQLEPVRIKKQEKIKKY